MQPKSNPNHYTDLLKELEEAPNRSWLGRIGKKLGGLIRFKS
jgi:cytochrome b pre-mRNA-processing protein 6